MKTLAALFLIFCLPGFAQDAPVAKPDAWKSLRFLEGTWDAAAQGNGGVAAAGTYTFRLELNDHILTRHSTSTTACKGPATFDCDHGDLLYV